jgi:hypothetical protein
MFSMQSNTVLYKKRGVGATLTLMQAVELLVVFNSSNQSASVYWATIINIYGTIQEVVVSSYNDIPQVNLSH